MKIGKINSNVTTKTLEEDEVVDFIKRQANSDLYIVVDYGVFLGRVQDKEILLWRERLLENEPIQKKQFVVETELPKTKYIQEVRIFDKNMEVKITRTQQGFVWRKRQDSEAETGEITLDYIDECYKLWGSVKKVGEDFSVLQEDRGTTIVIPGKYEGDQKVGLIFRKYVSFQDRNFVTEQPFSYQIIDERLVTYCEFGEGFEYDK